MRWSPNIPCLSEISCADWESNGAGVAGVERYPKRGEVSWGGRERTVIGSIILIREGGRTTVGGSSTTSRSLVTTGGVGSGWVVVMGAETCLVEVWVGSS